MLYRESEEFKLMQQIATYTQRNTEYQQHVIDETELKKHEERGNITNLIFIQASYDQDVLDRLEEVKNYPESELNTVHEYVLNNNVLKGTSLETKKQNETLERSILELALVQEGGLN